MAENEEFRVGEKKNTDYDFLLSILQHETVACDGKCGRHRRPELTEWLPGQNEDFQTGLAAFVELALMLTVYD